MLKDNFNKFCLAVIALLLLLSLFFTIRASAEEYEQPTEQTETTTEDTTNDTADETHEVIQVQGVQTYDPQLYDRLDKMQESIDALTAALVPSDALEESAEESPTQDTVPDYTAQLSGISSQLEILSQQATAETAEPSVFEKPFEDYSTSEGLSLVLAVSFILVSFVLLVKAFIL